MRIPRMALRSFAPALQGIMGLPGAWTPSSSSRCCTVRAVSQRRCGDGLDEQLHLLEDFLAIDLRSFAGRSTRTTVLPWVNLRPMSLGRTQVLHRWVFMKGDA